ncbi:ABC transporter substrate-binding protein [Kribbella sandramycini]|uniref:ABC transporter substrate-binding protein n=1 Tax=Kribbella sandramycini TaxID=60450 RepID=A0A7Y4L308_9ACTN|nr:ABC transporter substrate-binding protein [Kribbella sandramycini]MBB6571154.1 peptide/nickel transport system substrate-binding protein [Kribbella sandramycini]NOL43438.1 ABC transporter substrate-binding protein [Kribbella sandramycini]
MRARRSVALALTGLLAAAALAACSNGDGKTNTGAAGGATVLNVGMPNGPQTENHNPFLGSSSGASLGYRWMIFEPLVMINGIKPTEAGKPWLATEWKWEANFTKLSFTIRDGVKWSDGKPMTAEDVAYTFQLRKDNDGLNSDAIPYKTITQTGNKVDLTFERSQFVNQNKLLTVFVIPKHQWSTLKDPSQDTLKQPIGTGPYKLKSFTPQTTTLELRDSYWQELPKVKELRYTSYNDNNAQTTALANGASEWSFVFVPNVKAVYQDKDPKNHKLYFPANLGIHGLWINTTNKPFDDPALRRAMDKVINRDDIFMQGEAGYFYPKVESITGIPTPAGESFIAPEFKDKKHAVDVEGAKADLAAAGYKLEGDVLKDKTGKPVEITLTNPAGWSDYITDLEIIKDNLSTIGIKATVDKANQDAWFKAFDEGTFEAGMHWTNGGATPYDIYQNIMDGKILKPVGKGGISGNYGRFSSPEATQLLDTYANATDDATRTTALNGLQKIMVEQMPVIPTSASNVGGLYSTKNWTGWPDEQNSYAPGQPTQQNALEIVLKLKPAGSQ